MSTTQATILVFDDGRVSITDSSGTIIYASARLAFEHVFEVLGGQMPPHT